MAKPEKVELEEYWARGCLIGVSLIAGIVVFSVLMAAVGYPVIALIVMVVVWFGYPVLGGWAAQACDELKLWADEGDAEHFKRFDKIWLGALWPIALPSCVILFTFLRIIRRLY